MVPLVSHVVAGFVLDARGYSQSQSARHRDVTVGRSERARYLTANGSIVRGSIVRGSIVRGSIVWR